MFNFIYYIKTLAMALIVNSHLDALYPIPQLATGGALGNGLFFIVSGFCIAEIKKPFFQWFFDRFKRIYPPTLIAVAINFILFNKFSPELFHQKRLLFEYAIFPTIYWFCGAIMLFYFLYYFIVKSKFKYTLHAVFAVSLSAYALIYVFLLDTSYFCVEDGYFKWIYYFLIMLSGYFIRKNSSHFMNKNTKAWSTLCVFALVFIYVDKFLMTKSALIMHLQFLNQVGVYVFCTSLFVLLMNLEEKINTKTKSFFAIKRLGTLTLEIYLMQEILKNAFITTIFPLNIILTFISVILCAEIFHRLYSPFNKKRQSLQTCESSTKKQPLSKV